MHWGLIPQWGITCTGTEYYSRLSPFVLCSPQATATCFSPVAAGMKGPTHSEAKPPDLLCCSVCNVGVWDISALLGWNLLGGPHESGYIYLLPQTSPLAQCSTATTCTIQTWLCSIPLYTEGLGGGGEGGGHYDMWTCFFFLRFAHVPKWGLNPGPSVWKAATLPLRYYNPTRDKAAKPPFFNKLYHMYQSGIIWNRLLGSRKTCLL